MSYNTVWFAIIIFVNIHNREKYMYCNFSIINSLLLCISNSKKPANRIDNERKLDNI